ncbi:TPA: DUF916 and DUF3324 domain-containing protein [Listeria innocua]|nr:DUF916 and DUF3324 domain-containing protein [Listeria innocua]
MKGFRVAILLMLTVFVGLKMNTHKVEAAEMNFSVQAVIPENQVDKSKTYFDLKMVPGQEQDIEITMKNDTSKDVVVEMNHHTATTNDNGIADYSGSVKEPDSSLKYDLNDYIQINKEVTIPANGTITTTAHVKMPDELFDGVLLGGFTFIEKEKSENLEAQKGTQIVNKYAYTIGIQIQETDTSVVPELILTKVSPNQINYRNVIQANIQNSKPAIIKDLKIEGKVFKKGDKLPLYETNKTGLRMAPNSNFNYSISMNNEEFKPGKYVFKGIAQSADKEWEFEKEFTIQGAAAKKYNNKAVELDRDYSLYIYLGIAVLMVTLIIIILILMKKVNQNKKV